MSKLVQIERALQELDQATFERLADSYLKARGYDRPNPLGLVPGADKTKVGTPDTWVPLEDGTFVFSESTTQKTGVAAKLLEDFAKCLSEEKTGIPRERIREIIACHNSVLSPEDERSFFDFGQKEGCVVTVFGLGPIAHDLYQKYPRLAKDFLGVEVDTGQIISIDEYIEDYGRNALATPLDTAFYFRGDDVDGVVASLQATDFVLLAGPPGVGKSRMAIECCRRFLEANPSFRGKAVFYKGRDLFEDICVYFSAPGDHLVFLDDVNRVSGFRYLLDLLQQSTDDRRVKIIATVRDYALMPTRDLIAPYGRPNVVPVGLFSDQQIRELLNKEFGIGNPLLLDWIETIARGNARIAVMAARLAKSSERSASITDATELFDEYFKSVRGDIQNLADPELLRAAGVLAVFRKLDLADQRQMRVVEVAFHLEESRFRTAVHRLHELEVVDLYENEVAQVADQILASYLFYVAFFRDRALSPAGLLHSDVFPAYRHRVMDAVNGALASFDGRHIGEALRPLVRERWRSLADAGQEQELLELVDAFGPLEDTEALLFARRRIEGLQALPTDSEVQLRPFKPARQQRPNLWSVLSGLRRSELGVVRMALSLAADALAKRPTDAPEALALFEEDFGIHHDSWERSFDIQIAAIEELWSRVALEADGSHSDLFLRLFARCATSLLKTEFHDHQSKGDMAITIKQFSLLEAPDTRRLRDTVLARLCRLLEIPTTRWAALELISVYTVDQHMSTPAEMIAADAAQLVPALLALPPGAPQENVVVNAYVALLSAQDPPSAPELSQSIEALRVQFDDDSRRLTDLLAEDFDERREMGWREYHEAKRVRIRDMVSTLDVPGFLAILDRANDIRAAMHRPRVFGGDGTLGGSRTWEIDQGIALLFGGFADSQPSLYPQAVEEYLARGDVLQVHPHSVVPRLVALTSLPRAEQIIRAASFPHQGFWLSALFAAAMPAMVDASWVAKLLDHFETAAARELGRDLQFLLAYRQAGSRVVARTAAILVRRAAGDKEFGIPLGDLFNEPGGIADTFSEDFAESGDVVLLEGAYLVAQSAGGHLDYRAASFSVLCDRDPAWPTKWIASQYERHLQKGFLSRYDDSRDYSRLWLREDHKIVMRQIFTAIQEAEKSHGTRFSYGHVYLRVLDSDPQKQEIRARQDELLGAWIDECSDDSATMEFVFSLAADFPPERRTPLVARFLAKNQDFAVFNKLRLEPSQWSWSGSKVPLLQRRISFYEGLLPLTATVALLEHRAAINDEIARLHKSIEGAKREEAFSS